MSFTVKLAITFWVLGLGISAMESVVAPVGIAIMSAGAILGIVALLVALATL